MLARRVARGQDITEAVFATMDELKAAPGAICPIEDVPDVPTDEVSIEGEVIKLWAPSDPAIAQVSLIVRQTHRKEGRNQRYSSGHLHGRSLRTRQTIPR